MSSCIGCFFFTCICLSNCLLFVAGPSSCVRTQMPSREAVVASAPGAYSNRYKALESERRKREKQTTSGGTATHGRYAYTLASVSASLGLHASFHLCDNSWRSV